MRQRNGTINIFSNLFSVSSFQERKAILQFIDLIGSLLSLFSPPGHFSSSSSFSCTERGNEDEVLTLKVWRLSDPYTVSLEATGPKGFDVDGH